MSKIERLLDILIENEIILGGKTNREDLIKTIEFQILKLITEYGALAQDEIEQKIGKEGINLQLFSLVGDGFVEKKEDKYNLVSNIRSRIFD